MDFGRLEDLSQLDQIDFRLPPDDPRTWVQLRRFDATTSRTRIKIGCPAWGTKAWVGKVYPAGTPAKDFLSHYVHQFTSIELNTTHYRIPDRETIVRWRDTAPKGFSFCPKFPQEISHRRPLSSHRSMVEAFIESVTGLEDKLGLSFLQLPPTFDPQDLSDLRLFLDQIPKGFRIALEMRHPALFNEHKLIAPLFDLMARKEVSPVITDVAGRRDVLHFSLPAPRAMVRFIGNDLHPSDYHRIDEWVARIETWIHLGLEELHFFIHQHEDVFSPDLITYFIDRLNERCALDLPKWKPVPTTPETQQLGLF